MSQYLCCYRINLMSVIGGHWKQVSIWQYLYYNRINHLCYRWTLKHGSMSQYLYCYRVNHLSVRGRHWEHVFISQQVYVTEPLFLQDQSSVCSWWTLATCLYVTVPLLLQNQSSVCYWWTLATFQSYVRCQRICTHKILWLMDTRTYRTKTICLPLDSGEDIIFIQYEIYHISLQIFQTAYCF